MKNAVITIGREYGSGGSEIGRKVADRLGIPFYDKHIIEKAAEQSGMSPEFINEQEQAMINSMLYSLSMAGTMGGYGTSTSDQVYIAESNVIREMADEGACVIVGRCADYVLRDRPCLNVFIYADTSFRIKRIAELYSKSETDASREIKAKDKLRSRHYKFYCDREWGDMRNYSLCINTAEIGIDGAVDMIVSAYKNM